MPVAIGPIENFKTGWAIIPFVGEKPHYWEDVTDKFVDTIYKGERVRFYKSLCGVYGQTYKGIQAIVPGDFPLCKRCMKIKRRMKL